MAEYKDKKQIQRRENQQSSVTPLQKKQQAFQLYTPPPITTSNIQLKDIDRSTFKPATGKYAEQHQAMIQRFGLKRFNNEQQSTAPLQKKENKTGLPDNLKAGVENLSGMSMDDVKVHYNSSKPSQLQAHAYAQGTDIHLASGQEKHLPHEAWHVAQQKQGRVKPTTSMNGVNINDDKGLEREADVMGGKAMQMKQDKSFDNSNILKNAKTSSTYQLSVIQLGKGKKGKGGGKKGGGGNGLDPNTIRNHLWLHNLYAFLQYLNETYPQNDGEPDGSDVAEKDQMMRPPTSGIKGSDHHTNTSGGGKKGRHVSSNQLIGDVQEKIETILGHLNMNNLPAHCKDTNQFTNWYNNGKGPDGGGGGLMT